jgi:hypothetical protein
MGNYVIDYGLLAAKLSDIFSNLLWQLQSFLGYVLFFGSISSSCGYIHCLHSDSALAKHTSDIYGNYGAHHYG